MEKAYNLILSDGSTWLLHAEESVSEWLDKLAQIMKLKSKTVSADHSIYFYASQPNNAKISSKEKEKILSQRHQEDFYEGRLINLWINNRTSHHIVELDNTFFHIRDIYYMDMSTAITPIFFHSLNKGGTPVHAALAAFQNKGILIAATGDTGKTTCCNRLPKNKWRSYCDDLSLLIKNQQGKLNAHPLPTWNDFMLRNIPNSWPVEESVPIKAIFFLEQHTCDQVVPLAPLEASLRLFETAKEGWFCDLDETHQQKKIRISMIFNITQQIGKEIPSYILRATLNGKFWEKIEEVL